MKAIVLVALLAVAAVCGAEEKKQEKRGALGLGYPGFGHGLVGAAPLLAGHGFVGHAPLLSHGYYGHGLGLYNHGLYGHGLYGHSAGLYGHGLYGHGLGAPLLGLGHGYLH